MSERLKRFEAWVATRNEDVRKPEVARIGAELLEIAGDEAILELDVQTLVKRYKQGLAGAQRVLAAQRVGELMLRWQDEELHPKAPAPAPPPSPAPARFDVDLYERGGSARPPAALPEPEAAPKSVVPGPKVSTWARPAASEAPPPLFEEDNAAVVDAWLGATEGRAREASLPQIDAFDEAPRSPRPPARDDRPSQLPAALGPLEAQLGVDAGSIRPRARGSDAPPPNRSDFPSAMSSRPPSVAPGLTDPKAAPMSGIGLMVAPSTVAPRERVPLPPPSTPYPLGAIAAANLTPDRRIDASGAKMWGGIGFAVLLGIAVVVVITRPSCMFADPGKPVTGPFVDKYLGLKLTFPERWLYGEDLDDKEKTPQGYQRRISVFYQGTSATDYAAKLEVITLFKEGEKVTEEIARNNGAGETLDQARYVNCNPIVRGTVRGTRCTSVSQQLGSPAPYATVEYYFPLGTYTVFARGRVKVPSMMSGGGPPGMGAPGMGGPPGLGGPGMAGIPSENKEVLDRLDQIEDIIDSIDVAR
ncbi:MAG: hypothetical protein U0414_22285 [Polyangiaceae bacterium]